MKANKKIISIVLAIVLVLSASAVAFADWVQYGDDDDHNAYLTSGAPTSMTGNSSTAINLTPGLSGYSGVENTPVMQTINGTTYAYVLFNGRGTNGAQVAKYNANTRTEIWRTTAYGTQNTSLNAQSGFQLSTPYLDTKGTDSDNSDDVLYVGVLSQYDDYVGGEWLTGTGSKILRISNLDADGTNDMPLVENIWTNITGQINTPIVKYGNYIYFGTWVSNTGAGTYYQIDVSGTTVTSNNVKTYSPGSYGFYWAGAVSDGTRIYFGGDNGKLYWRQAGSKFGTKGGVLDLTDTNLGGIGYAGNVRSTVVLYNGSLYFTSQGSAATAAQGGYLWCCNFDTTESELVISWYAGLVGGSTSTPTIVNNRIYVGTYGVKGKGIRCVDISTHAVTQLETTLPIQSQIAVMRSGNLDYLYFTVNDSIATANNPNHYGGGYCYSYNGSTLSSVWSISCAYALNGMAIDGGKAAFGNDGNAFYIVQ